MLCYIFYGDRIIIIASASLPDCTCSIPKYVFFKNVTSKKLFLKKNSPLIAGADASKRRERPNMEIFASS